MPLDFKILKRDERIVSFDSGKIYTAIEKAFRDTYPKSTPKKYHSFIADTVHAIEQRLEDMELLAITIDEIQELVIDELLDSSHKEVAINYIQYKTKKSVQRISNSDIEKQLQKLIERDETVVHENANKDSKVFNTQRDLTAGVSAKSIGLRMLPTHIANAHAKGDIHYHDLDYQPYAPMTNCSLPDFKFMFENGFNIGNAEVEKPKSIGTAGAQIAQIIANVASSQYGGTSVDMIDQLLAPYAEMNYQKNLQVAKGWVEEEKQLAYAEEQTLKQIYDAVQGLEYEINTLYTSNGQTPFTTFGFGLGTDRWSREIQKAILEVRIKGLGKEKRTAIFPKLVFFLEDGLNLKESDPNYDVKQLALECATKRMYPDVISAKRLRELTGGGVRTPMGCRSFLQTWTNELGEQVNAGRMNLGVVTLNIPRIAIESGGDKKLFWRIFQERLAVLRDALVYRVERSKQAKPENAPILYTEGAWGKKLAVDEEVDELFKNKRATISMGYIGLYEAATVFYGPDWETNLEAKTFTVDILRVMKSACDIWGDQYGYHFSVYGTPSESLTDRFCKMDKALFGSIPDITDKDYYTNSFHYDVRKKPTPFEKLDFEKEYLPFTSGGFINYCEYPNLKQNPKALETVWDYAYDRVAYLGTNTPIDHCYECGFTGDFHPTERGFECPECKNHNPETCDVVKRTCGYLGNPQKRPMVNGRHKEISARVKHMDPVITESEESDCSI